MATTPSSSSDGEPHAAKAVSFLAALYSSAAGTVRRDEYGNPLRPQEMSQSALAALAQAEATLALAEQQRIANIIALAQLGVPANNLETMAANKEALRALTQDQRTELKDEIRAALGLPAQRP